MKRKTDWLPWYRRSNYKGNLSEREKRYLDTVRARKQHPAVRYEDLPEEAQEYIAELELLVYDGKQEKAGIKALVLSGLACAIMFGTYHDILWTNGLFGYSIGCAIFVVAWLNYRYEWRRNIEEDQIPISDDNTTPTTRTQEKLEEHWELAEVSRFKTKSEDF